MRRASLSFKLKSNPAATAFLHECRSCHVFGIKPSVIDTRLGDYGMRDYLGERYEVLYLSADGLCSACAAKLNRDESTGSVVNYIIAEIRHYRVLPVIREIGRSIASILGFST